MTADAYKLTIAEMQKEIHNLQVRVAELVEERDALKSAYEKELSENK